MDKSNVPSEQSAQSAPSATLYCSFCGKSQHEVKKLIAGPRVYICDECVDLCANIVAEERGEDKSKDDKESSHSTPATRSRALDTALLLLGKKASLRDIVATAIEIDRFIVHGECREIPKKAVDSDKA